MPAIITAAFIPMLLNLALEVFKRWPELVSIAKQNGELTPEQEADFDRRRAEAYASTRWQPTDGTSPTKPS